MEIMVDIHTHHPRECVLSPTMTGIHPWDAERGLELPDFASCDIIGETGLDYACDVSIEAQERLFRQHLEAAEHLAKPVVLHVVRGFERVMSMLADYTLQGVVFHGFIGSQQQASRATKRGYYLSFGLRSLRSERTRQAIGIIPLDRLFVESDDDPDIDLLKLYGQVAELKHITPQELMAQTTTNYTTLFRKGVY